MSVVHVAPSHPEQTSSLTALEVFVAQKRTCMARTASIWTSTEPATLVSIDLQRLGLCKVQRSCSYSHLFDRRQPSARASSSEQNIRSPLAGLITVSS